MLRNYDVLSSQKPMSEENYSLVQQETKDLTDTIDHDKPIDFNQILDSTNQESDLNQFLKDGKPILATQSFHNRKPSDLV